MSGEIVARGDHCNLFATASKLHRRCVSMFSRYPFRSHPINWVPTCSWAVDEAGLIQHSAIQDARCEVPVSNVEVCALLIQVGGREREIPPENGDALRFRPRLVYWLLP